MISVTNALCCIVDLKGGCVSTSRNTPVWTNKQVWKGGQSVYRLMIVHVNHAVARTACRSGRINFADLLILCAHFQVDFMGGDFNAFSYRYSGLAVSKLQPLCKTHHWQ